MEAGIYLIYIYFGFPIDFNRDSVLRWKQKNHNSAIQHPGDVDAYLQEEIQYQAIMGPFEACPIPNCHFSPFLTRGKAILITGEL